MADDYKDRSMHTQNTMEDVTSEKSTGGDSGKEDKEANCTRKRYLEIISDLTTMQTNKKFCGANFPYTFDQIVKILMFTKRRFKKEGMLVEINPPCVIVGDIHGQYTDLMRVFGFFNVGSKPGYKTQRYVFLGDYVDRGCQSLECIMLVLMLKAQYPDSIKVLRGNHECKAVNRVYGFFYELTDRFGEARGSELFGLFNDVFNYLPLACLIGKRILCMHGGISPHLRSLDDIRNIKKPLEDPPAVPLAMDLMWSDPMIDLKGFETNITRRVSVCFGEDAVKETCLRLEIKLIVRAHQMMMNGFGFFADRKLITVFTAPNYLSNQPNRGCVAIINRNGHVGFKLLVPTYDGQRGEQRFRRIHDDADKSEDGNYKRKVP